MKNFLEAKNKFDERYVHKNEIKAFLPVDLSLGKNFKIKNSRNKPNEEYYKWQFFYSLIHSGLYQKDYIGAEIYFPKGSKTSAPLKLDGVIFDNNVWFEWYVKWRRDKDQEALEWLRKHLVGAIEFKKEELKDVETVYNQQLKPAIKESEADFCLGILYGAERLYLFQKKNNKILRYDESKNRKGAKSGTKDLSLDLPDGYPNMPSFDEIINKINKSESIDRSKRTINELGKITSIHTRQVSDALSNILRTLDKVGLDQIGYGLLIQALALKIFDEKNNKENINKPLRFYITDEERKYKSLADFGIQQFIKRIRTIYDDARGGYQTILGEDIIDWKNASHISAIVSIVENFQDYSFVKSYKTDLYQLVFFRFANEFAKERKGQFITPIWLIDFLVKIVNPRGNETIIDPCVGIADFLSLSYVNSSPQLCEVNLYGIDNDQQMIMLAQLNMLLNGDGNAKLYYIPNKGSIDNKLDITGRPVMLIPKYHKNGEWDNWPDKTELKKFKVVLTNPPFGEDRAYRARTPQDREIVECYEVWNLCRQKDWIDLGLLFLENGVRLLKEGGRIGIVQSNSIASIDRWEKARKWLLENVRVVALFDLPSNVFADTGANTTLVVAYKPSPKELEKLKNQGYSVFVKDIQKVGYEVRTSKRVKYYHKIRRIDEETFDVKINEQGESLLDEEFTETVNDFREWCLEQEKTLQDLFIKQG